MEKRPENFLRQEKRLKQTQSSSSPWLRDQAAVLDAAIAHIRSRLVHESEAANGKFLPSVIKIIGEDGTGRTSFLGEVASWARLNGIHTHTISAENISLGVADLFRWAGLSKSDLRSTSKSAMTTLRDSGFLQKIAMRCAKKAGQCPVILLIDGFDRCGNVERRFLVDFIVAMQLHSRTSNFTCVVSLNNSHTRPMTNLESRLMQIDAGLLPLSLRLSPLSDLAVASILRRTFGQSMLSNDEVLKLGELAQCNLLSIKWLSQGSLECIRKVLSVDSNSEDVRDLILESLVLNLDEFSHYMLATLAQLRHGASEALIYSGLFAERRSTVEQSLNKLDDLGLVRLENGFVTLRESVFKHIPEVVANRGARNLTEDLVDRLGRDKTLGEARRNAEITLLRLRLNKERRNVERIFDTAQMLANETLFFDLADFLEQAVTYILGHKTDIKLDQSTLRGAIKLTRYFIDQSMYALAIRFAQPFVEMIRTTESRYHSHAKNRGELLFQVARALRYQGKFELSLQTIDASATQCGLVFDDPRGLHLVALRITIEVSVGRYKSAHEAINKLLGAELPSTKELVQLWILQGHCHKAFNNDKAAMQCYERAEVMARELWYETGLATALESFGLILFRQKRLEAAYQKIEEAWRIFKKVGNANGVVSSRYSLARVHFDLGYFEKGISLVKECIVDYQISNNKRELCDATLELGIMLRWVGDLNDAAANLRFANWLADDIGAKHVSARCKWHLFQIEFETGNIVDAQLHLVEARKRFQQLGFNQATIRCDLAMQIVWRSEASSTAMEKSWLLAARQLPLEHQITLLSIATAKRALDTKEVQKWLKALSRASEKLLTKDQLHLYYVRVIIHAGSSEKIREHSASIFSSIYSKLFASCGEEYEEKFALRWKNASASTGRFSNNTDPNGSDEIERRLGRWEQAICKLQQFYHKSSFFEELLDQLNHTLESKSASIIGVNDVDMSTLSDCIRGGQQREDGLAKVGKLVQRPDNYTLPSETVERLLQTDVVELVQRTGLVDLKQHGRLQHEHLVSGFVVPIFVHSELFGLLHVDLPGENVGVLERSVASSAATMIGLALSTVGQRQRLQDAATTRPAAKDIEKNARARVIIDDSIIMKELMCEVEALRNSHSSLIIEGESGTGKEFIARYVHDNGLRSGQKFLVVDCAAVSDELFEAQCFGYRRGAFTGAHEDRIGFFELACGGTLFLDNVTDLSLMNQAKLLRALQEGRVRPVGATDEVEINVRIIASAQSDLLHLANQGRFRLDLFYRLDVLRLRMPPLRDRIDDLEGLVDVLQVDWPQNKRVVFSLDALQALKKYTWPGNVRELANELNRLAACRSQGGPVQLDEISTRMTNVQTIVDTLQDKLEEQSQQGGLNATLDQISKRIIRTTLDKHQGNVKRAAQELKIPRSSLRHRIKKLGI